MARSALVLLVACLPATAFLPAPLHGAWLEPRRRGHDGVMMGKKKRNNKSFRATAAEVRGARASARARRVIGPPETHEA